MAGDKQQDAMNRRENVTLTADERIERCGIYFTHHHIQDRFHITFERFLQMIEHGTWQDMIDSTERRTSKWTSSSGWPKN